MQGGMEAGTYVCLLICPSVCLFGWLASGCPQSGVFFRTSPSLFQALSDSLSLFLLLPLALSLCLHLDQSFSPGEGSTVVETKNAVTGEVELVVLRANAALRINPRLPVPDSSSECLSSPANESLAWLVGPLRHELGINNDTRLLGGMRNLPRCLFCCSVLGLRKPRKVVGN